MNDQKIVPIKKIFRIIDSCTNVKQLKTCKRLADLYTERVRRQGVINPTLVNETLYIRINEKKEELRLSNQFNGKIRRKKITVQERIPEYYFTFENDFSSKYLMANDKNFA